MPELLPVSVLTALVLSPNAEMPSLEIAFFNSQFLAQGYYRPYFLIIGCLSRAQVFARVGKTHSPYDQVWGGFRLYGTGNGDAPNGALRLTGRAGTPYEQVADEHKEDLSRFHGYCLRIISLTDLCQWVQDSQCLRFRLTGRPEFLAVTAGVPSGLVSNKCDSPIPVGAWPLD
jgi:hypothetical protein